RSAAGSTTSAPATGSPASIGRSVLRLLVLCEECKGEQNDRKQDARGGREGHARRIAGERGIGSRCRVAARVTSTHGGSRCPDARERPSARERLGAFGSDDGTPRTSRTPGSCRRA